MKRKTYKKKLRALLVAIQQHPMSRYPEGYKPGESMKDSMSAKMDFVNGKFHSYDEAWNCSAMKWAREYYMGEVIK